MTVKINFCMRMVYFHLFIASSIYIYIYIYIYMCVCVCVCVCGIEQFFNLFVVYFRFNHFSSVFKNSYNE